jgi:hypothetical protein
MVAGTLRFIAPDRRGIVHPSRPSSAVRVGDMHSRAKIAVEFLHLCQGEGIGERRKLGRRELLCHKEQQAGSFGEGAPFGHQRRNASLRVYREVFRAPLGLGTEIDPHRLIRRTSLFERNMRGQRTSARRVIKLQHGHRPFFRVAAHAIAASTGNRLRATTWPAPSRRVILQEAAGEGDPIWKSMPRFCAGPVVGVRRDQ